MAETLKMEKDWSAQTDSALLSASTLSKSSLSSALESLSPLEKQSRTSADLASNTKILMHGVTLCAEMGDFKAMGEWIVVLCKKRALLKQVF